MLLIYTLFITLAKPDRCTSPNYWFFKTLLNYTLSNYIAELYPILIQWRVIAYIDTLVEDPRRVQGSLPYPKIWKIPPPHLICSISCYYGIGWTLEFGPGSVALTVKDLVQELTKSPKKNLLAARSLLLSHIHHFCVKRFLQERYI